MAVALPKPVLRIASGIDRLLHRKKAKLTADRVGYFCHPDWVAAADRRPPARLWQARIGTEDGLRQTADWYRAQGWLG